MICKLKLLLICVLFHQAIFPTTLEAHTSDILRMKLSFGRRYNINTFAIAPNSSILPLRQGPHIFSPRGSGYIVYNIGRTAITAKLKYGLFFKWKGNIVTRNVNPGEKIMLINLSERYHITGIEVTNEDKRIRAITQIYDEAGFSWSSRKESDFALKFDINNALKGLTLAAVDQVPKVGSVFSALIGFFWPSTSKDIWKELTETLKKFVNSEVTGLIENIFDTHIRVFGRKINVINDGLKNGEAKKELTKHVMNLAQDMVGFEEEFVLKKAVGIDVNQLNFYILPLYSAFMTLKLLFYQYAVVNNKQLGLDVDDVKEIEFLAKDALYNGVEEHFNGVLHERIERAYGSCVPDNTYNAIETMRTYVNFAGKSFLPLWKQIVEKPNSTEKPYNDVLLYPTYFGRQTIPLLMLATLTPHEPPKPLTPNLVDGKRARLTEIEVHTVNIDRRRVFCGMVTQFSDGTKFYLGNVNGDHKTKVNLNDTYIYRLVVDGNAAPEQITIFTNKEGTEHYTFGTSLTKTFKGQSYHLQNYHIAAIFVDNDGPNRNRAWNIAVSYLSNND